MPDPKRKGTSKKYNWKNSVIISNPAFRTLARYFHQSVNVTVCCVTSCLQTQRIHKANIHSHSKDYKSEEASLFPKGVYYGVWDKEPSEKVADKEIALG